MGRLLTKVSCVTSGAKVTAGTHVPAGGMGVDVLASGSRVENDAVDKAADTCVPIDGLEVVNTV